MIDRFLLLVAKRACVLMCNPLRASLSEVQHRSRSASQVKNLQLEGARDAQVSSAMGSTVRPQNLAAYVDLIE